MVLTLIKTKLQVDFNLLALVCLKNVALLSTHEVLERRSIGVIFKTGASKNLGDGLTIDLKVLNQLQLFSGAWLEVSLIPPEKATVCGRGDALNTRLSSDPVNIVNWVMVRLFQYRRESGPD